MIGCAPPCLPSISFTLKRPTNNIPSIPSEKIFFTSEDSHEGEPPMMLCLFFIISSSVSTTPPPQLRPWLGRSFSLRSDIETTPLGIKRTNDLEPWPSQISSNRPFFCKPPNLHHSSTAAVVAHSRIDHTDFSIRPFGMFVRQKKTGTKSRRTFFL